MRPSARHLLITALVACLLPGCALLKKFQRKHPAPRQEAKAPQQIGTVVLVNIEGSFVLIDNGYRISPPIGLMAQSQGPDGPSAQLKVTEMRKRPFVVADIVSGTPNKGDLVFEEKAVTPQTKQPSPSN